MCFISRLFDDVYYELELRSKYKILYYMFLLILRKNVTGMEKGGNYYKATVRCRY